MDDRQNKFGNLEFKRMLAQSVAVITGAIAECENHPCSFVNLGNPDTEKAALEIANSVFSGRGNSGIIFRVVFSNSKDMEDMIKQVISESGSTCPSCATVTCKAAKSRKGNN